MPSARTLPTRPNEFVITGIHKDYDATPSAAGPGSSPAVSTSRKTQQVVAGHALVIEFTEHSAALQRRRPRYPLLPSVLVGRLPVDAEFQRQGSGEGLLYDAMKRVLTHTDQVAAMAVIVDAIDERARSFYERHGFSRFASDPNRLYLPMTTVVQLVEDRGV
jgi:GNAT superfamily N-acetyltransferase